MKNHNKDNKENLDKLLLTASPFNTNVIYVYRNYLLNDRLNEKVTLEYDLDDKNLSKEIFDLYPEIPKKIKFWFLMKNKAAIYNFIVYQQSIKGKSFVERKILKESKADLIYLYKKTQYNIFFSFSCVMLLFLRSSITLGFLLIFGLMNNEFNTLGNMIFMKDYNDFLMKFQINKYYKLGKESSDFVDYLNSNYNEKVLKYNNKEYYDKFFVKSIIDVKFEKDDEIIDYLNINNKIKHKNTHDYHQEYLKSLENINQKKK